MKVRGVDVVFDLLACRCFVLSLGLDLDISGPLFGTNDQGKSSWCNIQHYTAIEGMCGWHSNHTPKAPWMTDVDYCEPFRGKEAVRAVRMAALSAIVLNTVGTELNLPNGGYGLTGVCNDVAALIEYAMRCVVVCFSNILSKRLSSSKFSVSFRNLLKRGHECLSHHIDRPVHDAHHSVRKAPPR